MKPGRTVGLSLAILASVMLFSILPLTQVTLVLTIRAKVQQVNLPLPGETDPTTPIAYGGDFTGVSDTSLVIQTVLAVIFLGIAICAWLGRPRWIRLTMWVAVLVLTVVTAVQTVAPMLSPPDLSQGFDSGASIARTLLSGRLLFSFLLALYVVWYMNRGPARAFYRGYYLQDPREAGDIQAVKQR